MIKNFKSQFFKYFIIISLVLLSYSKSQAFYAKVSLYDLDSVGLGVGWDFKPTLHADINAVFGNDFNVALRGNYDFVSYDNFDFYVLLGVSSNLSSNFQIPVSLGLGALYNITRRFGFGVSAEVDSDPANSFDTGFAINFDLRYKIG